MEGVRKINNEYVMEIKSNLQPEKTFTVKMSFLNKYSMEEAIARLIQSYKN